MRRKRAMFRNKESRRGRRIHTLQGPEDALGEGFIIFCGSAVSGHRHVSGESRGFLPMVWEVMERFFRSVSEVLEGGSYYEQRVAEYAMDLSDGKYRGLLERTKFEEFILRIESVLGHAKVNSFLAALFECAEGQFAANHSAIAHLLRERRASACLTTNFDNAIERAWPEVRTYVDDPSSPDYPSSFEGGGCLLKLHGDVVKGKYVATTEALYTAEVKEHYRFLERLLSGKTVLVVGYSCVGDVDISPHLTAADANLIWTVRPGGDPPRFGSRWVEYDLRSEDPYRNWLLGVAGKFGWNYNDSGAVPDWTGRLKRWFSDLPRDAIAELVREFFVWGAGWPVIHMDQLKCWEGEKIGPANGVKADWRRVYAYLGVADYISAERIFRMAQVDSENEARVATWKGFTLWRLGRPDDALATLKSVALSPKPYYLPDHVAEGRRIYLEIARDSLRSLKGRSLRTRFVEEWSLGEVINQASEQGESYVEDALRTRIASLDIKRLLGEPVTAEELLTVYRRCYDLQFWSAAEAAARVLAALDLCMGIKTLLEINRILIKLYNWHTIRKSFAGFLYAACPFDFPFIIDVLDGRFAARPWSVWDHWRSRMKIRKWRAAYLKRRT
jgi:hypothetical protein